MPFIGWTKLNSSILLFRIHNIRADTQLCVHNCHEPFCAQIKKPNIIYFYLSACRPGQNPGATRSVSGKACLPQKQRYPQARNADSGRPPSQQPAQCRSRKQENTSSGQMKGCRTGSCGEGRREKERGRICRHTRIHARRHTQN